MSTLLKHTPRPWKVAGPSAKGYLVVQGAEGNGVALILMESSDEEADARLIAAAPTMYEYIASSASNGCAEARKIMEAINASR